MITLLINDEFASIEFQFGKIFRHKAKPDLSLSLLIVQVLQLFCLCRSIMRKIDATNKLIILTPNIIVSLSTSSPSRTLSKFHNLSLSIKSFFCNDLNKCFQTICPRDV